MDDPAVVTPPAVAQGGGGEDDALEFDFDEAGGSDLDDFEFHD